MNEKNILKMPVCDQRMLAYLKRTNYDKYIEFLAKYVFPKKKNTTSDFEYWLWRNENKTTNKSFQKYLNSEV